MEFVTIKDVELCSAGMAWPSAGGPVTLTLEHIADCVRAGEDTLITPARLKIGHTDPRFADSADPGHDPFYDGEPAFGSIANMRLSNDGATAVGDYVKMPKWLADASPSAYPSRSIEGAYSIDEGPGGELIAKWDVETPGGKKYSFVLTACCLLGVQAPAVKDIEDLQFRLTEGRGVIVTGDPEAGGVPIAVSMGAVPSGAVSLEADVDAVIDAFCAEVCVDDRRWWWPRAFRVDPNAVIADDDEGSLWRFLVTTDDDQNVTFGNPERRLQTFVPAPEARAALAAAASDGGEGRIVKAFVSREQTPLRGRKEHPEGGGGGSAPISAMDFSDAQLANLRKRLDLAEDASEKQIAAALEAEPDETPATEPPAPAEPETTEETTTESTEEEITETEETSTEEPTVPVDKSALAELQANAELGRQAREQQVAQHRESVLSAALKAGKITPASKSAWETKLKAAPEATEAELGALPEGLVPVEEIGHGGSQVGTGVEVSAEEMGALFPGHGKVAA
jgi:Mu-like prophage I protein